MSRSLVIIGGGVAGLAAGCYARMNGYDVEIHEMHHHPGGLCTAWTREGYTFDLCIDWLTGSAPGSSLYPVWEELGIVQGRKFIDPDYFGIALDESGDRFTAWTDPDRLEEEMLRYGPEDGKFIHEFVSGIKRLMKVEMPMDSGFAALLKLLPALGTFNKYSIPVSTLTERITNPRLREFFRNIFDWHDQSAIFLMFMLAYMARKSAGYPLGGSVPVVRAMEQRYLSLGGLIRYGSKVVEVLVENDRAVGVRLEDGTVIRSDLVLSAADGYSTIFQWLPEKYADPRIQELYHDLKPFPPLVFVSMGVDGDYSKEPWTISFPLKKPIKVGEKDVTRLLVRNHARDPAMAPRGKSVFTTPIETDYAFWEKILYHSERYREEKDRICKEVPAALDEIYPGILDRVEVTDVATPHTFIRYTGNWKGSYEGWLMTKKTMSLRFPQKLQGLAGFYMAGQWVAPGGGLPGATTSARSAIRLLCKDEKRSFVSLKP
jgi:phytoene dehydrogenase-like protein